MSASWALVGERGIYNKLSARQNLEYWAVPYRDTSKRVNTLLERVGLSEKADQKAEGYSRGMKQRLPLARALVANAPVLFFDEPTMGMDPLAASLDSRFSASTRPNSLYRIEVRGADEASQVLQHLVRHGVTSIQTRRPSLEENYVYIVVDRGLSI